MDETDYLNRGAGDDALWIGRGDVANGGEGQDSFLLGGWLGGGDAAELTDIDPQRDQLVVVWSGQGGAAPVIEPRGSAEDPGMIEVCADGEVLAVMATAGAPSLDSIVLLEAPMAAMPTTTPTAMPPPG